MNNTSVMFTSFGSYVGELPRPGTKRVGVAM